MPQDQSNLKESSFLISSGIIFNQMGHWEFFMFHMLHFKEEICTGNFWMQVHGIFLTNKQGL